MHVRFLRDYRGRITHELFYQAGEVVELPDDAAHALLKEGVAEEAPGKPQESRPARKGRGK